MLQIKLINTNNTHFDLAWDLYENSFPIEERRSISSQKLIMNHPNYNFEIVMVNNELIGIILWWGFNDIRFIEHFTTTENIRGKGFGKAIIEKFKQQNSLPILLEVDIPKQNIDQRRIEFYQRLKFYLNPHFYQQPPLNKEHKALALLLMSYPDPISVVYIENFKKQYHPIIYQTLD